MRLQPRFRHSLPAAACILACSLPFVGAQELSNPNDATIKSNGIENLSAPSPIAPEAPEADDPNTTGLEVLTRGPIHEAYASLEQTNPVPGITVDRAPPEPIDEVPPENRPVGENVIWIPGYWGWDEDANDFIWVSGTYRNAPPNHRWIPGYWSQVENGFQWTSGFWIPATSADLQYLAPPPPSQEQGPNSPQPGPDYFWSTGSYVPSGNNYTWQPGSWMPYQNNFIWTSARYIYTPSGYVYVPGYWDYRLDMRGQLFAPVRINSALYGNTAYTPSVVLPFNALQLHMFAYPRLGSYVFGNYYDPRYASLGIRPWYQTQFVSGVPNPLFGYYGWAYNRSGVNYAKTLNGWNNHFMNNAAMRPAATLALQNQLAVSHNADKSIAHSLLATPLNKVVQQSPKGFVNVSANERANFSTNVQGLRQLSNERLKLEAKAGNSVNVGAAANAGIRNNIAPLALPKVHVPQVQAPTVLPGNLVRGNGIVERASSKPSSIPGNVIPGNLNPGNVIRGNQSGGVIPQNGLQGILPGNAPGNGPLRNNGGLLPGNSGGLIPGNGGLIPGNGGIIPGNGGVHPGNGGIIPGGGGGILPGGGGGDRGGNSRPNRGGRLR